MQTRQRKPTSSSLLLLIFAIIAVSSLVYTTDAAPAKYPSKQAQPHKRNPFLIRNLEVSGHDGNHQDLAQALGIILPGKRRLASVLGGSKLHGDGHDNQKLAEQQQGHHQEKRSRPQEKRSKSS